MTGPEIYYEQRARSAIQGQVTEDKESQALPCLSNILELASRAFCALSKKVCRYNN